LLLQTARQRQRWDDQQILPHVNWGDLFFDLFYVAAAYNLAVILKESPSWDGFLYFMCCYAPIQMMWNEKVMYDARFCPEDNLFHRAMEVVHILVLGTAIQHIRPVELMQNTSTNSTTFVFCLSLTLLTYLQIKSYWDVHSNVDGGEESKHHARSDVNRKIVTIVPFVLATALAGRDFFFTSSSKGEEGDGEDGNNLPILLCLLGWFVNQAYALLDAFVWLPKAGRNYKEVRVPMNVDFTIHRVGEWVMLMLGESVLSLLIVEQSPGRRYYVTFYAGILAVTMMQYLFFRSQPFDADDHAMRRAREGGFSFYLSMIGYSASLIVIGCSFKLILHCYIDEEEQVEGKDGQDEIPFSIEELSTRIANMFSWSLAASFFWLDMLIVSHRGWAANFSRVYMGGRINWAPTRLILCDFTLLGITATFSKWITNLELLSVAGCLMVLCQVAMRTRGLRYFPVSKKAMENACNWQDGQCGPPPEEAHRWPNVTEPQSFPTN